MTVYCQQPVFIRASLMAQMVKNLPAMQETRLHSLGWEDPLEKEIAIHSSILAWRIPWRAEPGGVQFMGSQRVTRGRRLIGTPHTVSLKTEQTYKCSFLGKAQEVSAVL